MNTELLFKEESYKIIGVCFEVYREKGCGFLERFIRSACFDKIILELKAAKELADEHRAQVQNYLKAAGYQLGLLVNFGHYPKVEIERIVNTRGRYDHGKRE